MLEKSKLRWTDAAAALGAGILLVLPWTVANRAAADAIGAFEIDGDRFAPSSGDPLDWDTASAPPMLDVVAIDDASGSAGEVDDVFGASSKESEPRGWSRVPGSVPQKSDIDEAHLGARAVDGHVWLYASAARVATSGAMNLSFEFNQSGEHFVNAAGEEVPERTPGDLMVLVLVSQGGQVSDVHPLRWAGTRDAGQWVTLGSVGDWRAATNEGQSGLANGHWSFVETAIDLTSFGVEPGCGGFGQAWVKTSSTTGAIEDGVFKDDGVLKDQTTRRPFALGRDLDGSLARGEALGLEVLGSGETLVAEGHAASHQAGAEGSDAAAAEPHGAEGAALIEAASKSAIDASGAETTAIAASGGVSLLGGIVRAEMVRVEARASASGVAASVSAQGSSVERVWVDHDADPLTPPVEVHGSEANVVVELDPAVFGAGSYVAVLEVLPALVAEGAPQSASFTATPPTGELQGSYEAGIRIHGIRVHVTGGAVPATEVIVSRAEAEAVFPQSFGCRVPQQVGASAFAVERRSEGVAPLTLGFVEIPPATGGEAERQVLGLHVPSVLIAELGATRAEGTVDPIGNSSRATSVAEVTDLCVLPRFDAAGALVSCELEVQSLRALAEAAADGVEGTTGSSVQLVDAAGDLVPTRPDDGPEIEIPGLARIFFDVREVVADPLGATSIGVTVTGILVELLDEENAGTEIRVASAEVRAFAPAATPLPEPGSAGMLAAGALLLLALRAHRRGAGTR